GPKCHSTLELVDASMSHQKEDWQNAIDEDISGWDGTASVKGEPPYAIFKFKDGTVSAGMEQPWAIFAFSDGTTKMVQHLKLMTDTNVGYDERWVRAFRVMVSTTGTDAGDFTTVYSGRQRYGYWLTHMFAATAAKYVKFVVDEPSHGWRQLGEIELMVADITGSQMANQETEIAVVQEFNVRNFPNPFNLETTIEVTLPAASHVKVGVYNLLGQQVQVLADHSLNAGSHRMRWNGRNEYGETVPCGIYYLRVQTADHVKVHRMLLLK
ncbi:T9SS type A sorting domain-containing protein, partial [candidate division KSB1 bacterium]|nr:T9SS type A sorting domain-containing protein [candidate division KSB1 bacterium]